MNYRCTTLNVGLWADSAKPENDYIYENLKGICIEVPNSPYF